MKHTLASAVARALRTRPERLVAAATGGALLAGLVAVPVVGSAQRTARLAALSCVGSCAAEGSPASRVPAPRATSLPSPADTRGAARPRPTPAASPVRVAPAPRPVARALAVPRAASRLPAGIDRTTAAAMAGMRLTPAGYRDFLRRIDRSYFDYAQRFVEFDPDRVPIEQGPSRVFVWHFTAFYRNADGPSSTASGRMAIRPFIKGLAERGDDDSPADHVCCGVNWLIDRHGPTHQLAPLNAKLRHNPPYDSVNTGVEIEAARQADITTTQYESTAYLTIAVLDAQGLLGRKPLQDIVKGHGEMRDAYLEDHPHSHLGERGDFDAPESRLLRGVIEAFLKAHPEVVRLRPHLR